jgi:hypothetical protein
MRLLEMMGVFIYIDHGAGITRCTYVQIHKILYVKYIVFNKNYTLIKLLEI